MRKIFAALHGLMLVILLVACASSGTVPASAIPEVLPSETATPQPPVDITWVDLNDARVARDLEELGRLTAARTIEDVETIYKWQTNPVVRWNEVTRAWVIYYARDPVVASRAYALVSVAQQRAFDEFARAELNRTARQPQLLDANIKPIAMESDPYEAAVLMGVAEPLLQYLFPDTLNEIQIQVSEARESLLVSANILPVDLETAENFGRSVAQKLIAERQDDGASQARHVDLLPSGEGLWKLDAFRANPEQPGWSKVTLWFMTTAEQFRAPPPPAFGSPEFNAELERVRQTMRNNTQKEYAIAQKWADKRGTFTPPGHWNLIAADLIQQYHLSNQDAAHVFAVLNMAMMDAGIACWDSKYHYMVIRPWQADPTITSLVGYPNHPSYPSGHSCFSWAGAETLAYLFPQESKTLIDMAEEASISRMYGGLHYYMDIEAGKEIGKQVGLLAREYAAHQNWRPNK